MALSIHVLTLIFNSYNIPGIIKFTLMLQNMIFGIRKECVEKLNE